MLCFDNSLLGDYLDGDKRAETFLEGYEMETWAVPSLALFEAYMGALVGRPRGTIENVYDATREFTVLPITDETALMAARLQRTLKSEGVTLSHIDALLAGTAKDHGATFATNDETFWKTPVTNRLDIAEYRR